MPANPRAEVASAYSGAVFGSTNSDSGTGSGTDEEQKRSRLAQEKERCHSTKDWTRGILTNSGAHLVVTNPGTGQMSAGALGGGTFMVQGSLEAKALGSSEDEELGS